MYNSKKGIVYEYETPDGKQKAIGYHDDQKPEFSNFNKVFLRLINDDFTTKMENGKRLISLKHTSQLKIIGYLDEIDESSHLQLSRCPICDSKFKYGYVELIDWEKELLCDTSEK